MKRIELRLFDLSVDRITEAIAHYLETHDTHIIYHIECHLESQPDIQEGEFKAEEQYLFFHAVIMRNQISAIDIHYDNGKNGEYDYWAIEIHPIGVGTNIIVKVETKSEAMTVFNILEAYILNQSIENL